eukprot:1936754-Heterocapsa_arctica.AAC.1
MAMASQADASGNNMQAANTIHVKPAASTSQLESLRDAARHYKVLLYKSDRDDNGHITPTPLLR